MKNDEIDVHLVQMTVRTGFDPSVEYSTSWLRHEVIAALSDLERDHGRFWGEDGELRGRWS